MNSPDFTPTDWKADAMRRRIRKRYAAERRFKFVGLGAVLLSAGFLAFLIAAMLAKGATGFVRTEIRLDIGPAQAAMIAAGNYEGAVGQGSAGLYSDSAWLTLRQAGVRQGILWLPAADAIDVAAKGSGTAEAERTYAALAGQGRVRTGINWTFLTGADATDPTVVGIWGAFKGSLLTMIVTLALAFPIGVLSAVYLEEYAPRNRWTDMIEVSINNLAAVPSIIFGLLGLAIFLNFMHLPRSAPLVGGITLALMTMPVIVIAGRNAIKSVPPSIRDAALGIGASRIQVVFHHVLPLALPGILTGTIIGMARALGETAPLLMIGMRAFIAAPPGGFQEPATALPVQIFLWSDEVSRGFVEKTSAAIIVLLAFLLAMNGLAIYLRNRFEKRW
jgi:phosphate transport system permease protein